MISPRDCGSRERMPRPAAAEVDTKIDLHEVRWLAPNPERAGTCADSIRKTAVNQTRCHHAHPLDIPKIPNRINIVSALNLMQTFRRDVDVIVDGAMHVVVSTRELPRFLLLLVSVNVL